MVQKEAASSEHANQIANTAPAVLRQKSYYQQHDCQGENFGPGKPPVAIKAGQHAEAGALVVLAVHQSDGEKMWELPEKQNCEEKPRIPSEAPRSARPTDQHRHSARKCAQQRAERSFSLQRRIH